MGEGLDEVASRSVFMTILKTPFYFIVFYVCQVAWPRTLHGIEAIWQLKGLKVAQGEASLSLTSGRLAFFFFAVPSVQIT